MERNAAPFLAALALAALGVAALAPVSPAAAQMSEGTGTAAASDPAATITAAELRVRVGALAHDSMAGRGTPGPGLEKTARYLAAKFRAFGLRPGVGDSSFFQPYPLTTIRPAPDDRQSLTLRGPRGAWSLDPRSDFVAVPVARRAVAEGPLVALHPEEEALDVRGRLAVLRVGPDGLQEIFARARALLADRGAAGALLVVEGSESYLDGLRAYFGSERTSLGEPVEFPGPLAIVPAGRVPAPLAAALDRGDLSAWTARLRTEARVERLEASNVVGWIEGSDPVLRYEYVVFSAHMDHLGVGRPVAGDSIYNGADDNASGTATLAELAQAFASAPERPRRSLVFLAVSGEERGLWGSRWYAEHPAFPLGRTVANLNMDMIGRNWRDTVVAIGKEASSLGPLAERVAAEHPELGLAVIDDPWPEERFFYRSDHYHFARNGVPILFFFSGVHEDYHRPSDEAEKLDYEKLARVGRLLYHVGWEVAQAEERPRWDEEAYRRVVGESP